MQTCKMKSSWVILADPASMTNLQERHTEKRRWPGADRGRGWRDAVVSRGPPGPPEMRRQRRPSPRASGEHDPADLDCGSVASRLRESIFPLL